MNSFQGCYSLLTPSFIFIAIQFFISELMDLTHKKGEAKILHALAQLFIKYHI